MKALSVKQPWAWAIVNGFKPIENRTRRTNHRGDILIHAGLDHAGDASWRAVRAALSRAGEDPDELPDLEVLATGGIVGRARLVDVITHSSSPWFTGPYGYVFTKPEPLKLIPWPGQLGVFEIPDHVLDRAEIKGPPMAQASLGL